MHARRRFRSRVAVGIVAALTALATWPGAQAASGRGTEVVPAKLTGSRRRRRHRATRSAGPHTSAWHGLPPPSPTPAPTPVDPVALVLRVARAQLGKPYAWGAAGPAAFDCSGLVQFAWRAAGVDLPHNSWAQQAAVRAVPASAAAPGDLVFFPGHVGIYIGNGLMIHAPHSGARVEIAPLRPDLIGFGRPTLARFVPAPPPARPEGFPRHLV